MWICWFHDSTSTLLTLLFLFLMTQSVELCTGEQQMDTASHMSSEGGEDSVILEICCFGSFCLNESILLSCLGSLSLCHLCLYTSKLSPPSSFHTTIVFHFKIETNVLVTFISHRAVVLVSWVTLNSGHLHCASSCKQKLWADRSHWRLCSAGGGYRAATQMPRL